MVSNYQGGQLGFRGSKCSPPPSNEYLYMYMCMYSTCMLIHMVHLYVHVCVNHAWSLYNVHVHTCTLHVSSCVLCMDTGFSAGYGCSAQAAVGDTVVSVCGHQEPTEICKSTAAPPVYVHLNASVYATRHT